jgi:hypothetical protein
MCAAAIPDSGIQLLINLNDFRAHQILTRLHDLFDSTLGFVFVANIVNQLL